MMRRSTGSRGAGHGRPCSKKEREQRDERERREQGKKREARQGWPWGGGGRCLLRRAASPTARLAARSGRRMRDPSRERGVAGALRLVPPLVQPLTPVSESLVPHSPCTAFGNGGDGGSPPEDGDGAGLDDGPTRTPSRRAIQALFGCCDRLDQALMVAAASHPPPRESRLSCTSSSSAWPSTRSHGHQLSEPSSRCALRLQ